MEIIYNLSFLLAVESVNGQLNTSILLYGFGKNSGKRIPEGTINMNILLESSSNGPVPRPKDSSYHKIMLYIYTSGTTGLPKAAVIKHSR